MAIDLAKVTAGKGAAFKKALKGEKGFLLAWDPVQQKEVWRYQYAGPWDSGIMTTAGNLVFQGNATHEFAAYRADNGDKLWSSPTQTAVLAGSMTYEVDGEQYVATLVGWGGSYAILGGGLAKISGPQRNISRLLVYKLGASGTLPPPAADGSEGPRSAEADCERRNYRGGQEALRTQLRDVSWRRCGQRRHQSGPALQQAPR